MLLSKNRRPRFARCHALNVGLLPVPRFLSLSLSLFFSSFPFLLFSPPLFSQKIRRKPRERWKSPDDESAAIRSLFQSPPLFHCFNESVYQSRVKSRSFHRYGVEAEKKRNVPIYIYIHVQLEQGQAQPMESLTNHYLALFLPGQEEPRLDP